MTNKQYKPHKIIWLLWNLKSGVNYYWLEEPRLDPGEYENGWRKVKYKGRTTRKKK